MPRVWRHSSFPNFSWRSHSPSPWSSREDVFLRHSRFIHTYQQVQYLLIYFLSEANLTLDRGGLLLRSERASGLGGDARRYRGGGGMNVAKPCVKAGILGKKGNPKRSSHSLLPGAGGGIGCNSWREEASPDLLGP